MQPTVRAPMPPLSSATVYGQTHDSAIDITQLKRNSLSRVPSSSNVNAAAPTSAIAADTSMQPLGSRIPSVAAPTSLPITASVQPTQHPSQISHTRHPSTNTLADASLPLSAALPGAPNVHVPVRPSAPVLASPAAKNILKGSLIFRCPKVDNDSVHASLFGGHHKCTVCKTSQVKPFERPASEHPNQRKHAFRAHMIIAHSLSCANPACTDHIRAKKRAVGGVYALHMHLVHGHRHPEPTLENWLQFFTDKGITKETEPVTVAEVKRAVEAARKRNAGLRARFSRFLHRKIGRYSTL